MARVGLLSIVVAGFGIGCGDDDDDDSTNDAGDHGSGMHSGGSHAQAGAGSGGHGGMDTRPDAEAGSGASGGKTDPELCRAAIEDATNDMVSNEATDCICENNATEDVVECDTKCWQLLECEAAKCLYPSDGGRNTSCIEAMCSNYITAIERATALDIRPCTEALFPDPELHDETELDAGDELDAGQ